MDDVQPLTFSQKTCNPACFKSPKRDNCLLVCVRERASRECLNVFPGIIITPVKSFSNWHFVNKIIQTNCTFLLFFAPLNSNS